jgi:hypothetical protein
LLLPLRGLLITPIRHGPRRSAGPRVPPPGIDVFSDAIPTPCCPLS